MSGRNYTLVSAEARHSANPDTFKIPPRAEREKLVVGDYVKLIFSDMERMWVHVMEKKPLGLYAGKLISRPVMMRGILKSGDEMLFGPEHVCLIDRKVERKVERTKTGRTR